MPNNGKNAGTRARQTTLRVTRRVGKKHLSLTRWEFSVSSTFQELQNILGQAFSTATFWSKSLFQVSKIDCLQYM